MKQYLIIGLCVGLLLVSGCAEPLKYIAEAEEVACIEIGYVGSISTLSGENYCKDEDDKAIAVKFTCESNGVTRYTCKAYEVKIADEI